MTDRLLPHCLDAERSVIGAVLLDEKAIFAASEIILADDFYPDAHRIIWKRLLELCEQDRGLDRVTLLNELSKHDELEKAGGAAYIAGLTDGLPRAVNVKHYARIVREKASLRRLIQAADETMTRAYQDQERPQEILERHESEIFKIASRECRRSFEKASVTLAGVYKEIESAAERRQAVRGIDTGLTELNRLTGGFAPQNLVVVAARPGMGKTSLVINIASHAATKNKCGVGIFSLEMSRGDLVKRMLSSMSEVPGYKLASGFMTKDDWLRVNQAASAIDLAEIHIDDSANLTMTEIRAKAQRLALEHSIDLIVVDYLQLISGAQSGSRYENRNNEITQISRGLKQLAKELDVPVIAVSQLNRDIERRHGNRKPMLSDLRDGGSIEQDADLVIFIYREDEKPEEVGENVTAELIIGKQRNGPTGAFQVAFLRQFTKFADLYRTEEQRNLYPAS